MYLRTITAGLVAAFGVMVSAQPALAATSTFNYTGAAQSFVVPSGITQILVVACGAQGGTSGGTRGLGGCATAWVSVTPGETLVVNVGSQGGAPIGQAGGSGGWNGGASGGSSTVEVAGIPLADGAGGGGGASDIRRQGVYLVVGGGGGGGGVDGTDANFGGDGGAGGGESGAPGGAGGGGGGTQTTGGTGGNSGTFGTGGAGRDGALGGGGGGGGYYGGGGSVNVPCAPPAQCAGSGGGGGGSGFGPVGVAFQSGEKTGNGQVTITVDTDPPETTITGGPSGATNDSTPTITFASDEDGSTFECRVDAAAFAPCNSPHTTDALVDGSHTFDVRATDAAANTDPTPASVAFTLDTTVPSPPPPPPTGCDIVGTAGNDVITGTAKGERICGLGGNDVIKGLGGNDVLIGGKGNDRLVGGKGKDRFLGGAGRDFLAMKDKAKEFGDGGKGIDTASTNRGDKLKRVEKRR